MSVRPIFSEALNELKTIRNALSIPVVDKGTLAKENSNTDSENKASKHIIKWNKEWLANRLYTNHQKNIFPGFSLNKADLKIFIDNHVLTHQAHHSGFANLYHNFVTINQESGNIVFAKPRYETGAKQRNMAALFTHELSKQPVDKTSQLFTNLAKSLTEFTLDPRINSPLIVFFEPCLQIENSKSPYDNKGCKPKIKTKIRAFNSIDEPIFTGISKRLTFMNRDSRKNYQLIRNRPSNLDEFSKFWNLLQNINIYTPTLEKTPSSVKVLFTSHTFPVVDSKLGKGLKGIIRIREIIQCASIRVKEYKTVNLIYPEKHPALGLPFTTRYYDNADNAKRLRLGDGAQSCDKDSLNITIDKKAFSWQSGYYSYAPPQDGFGQQIILQFPVNGIKLQSVNGLSLLDTHLESISTLDFWEAFPNLKKTTENFLGLGWSDLQTVLEDQSIKQSETIDVLGILIPLTWIYYFGSIAIIAIQLYMLAYTLRYVSLAKKYSHVFQEQNFPWIGITEGFLYKSMTRATTSILPSIGIFIASIFTFNYKDDFLTHFSIATVVLFEVIISILLWRTFNQLSNIKHASGANGAN